MTPSQQADQWLLTTGRWRSNPHDNPYGIDVPDEREQWDNEKAAYLAGREGDRWIPIDPDNLPDGRVMFTDGNIMKYGSELNGFTTKGYLLITDDDGIIVRMKPTHYQLIKPPKTPIL